MTADPARIGRYVIEAALGRGAMGVIYRAHDPDIDRPVAVKLIRADLLEGDDRSDFIARFRHEAQAAGRCTHPNIVAIYDFALHEGNPFLAMEFVDGMTLAQARAANARMPVADAVAIILQVLAALAAAHAIGVVHRDIKPANIMLTRAGVVKVADFGISRIDTSALTTGGMVIGTPAYMSPEQCRGDPVDARSDLFSVGTVLYELLAGAKPFAGRSAAETYARLLNENPPDLAQSRPDLSPAICAVIEQSLAKPVAARFPSAEAMAAALRQAAAASASAPASDHTIVLPDRPPPAARGPGTGPGTRSGTGTGTFDREVMDTLERKLAEHVGPIARHLVQSAARTAPDVDHLRATLAAQIERPADRDRFEKEVKSSLSGTSSSTGRTIIPANLTLSPADLERLQNELARYLGPVARVLIKRALPTATSPAALWRTLSTHIETDRDRAAFLRQAPP